jgi:hypothetical protein
LTSNLHSDGKRSLVNPFGGIDKALVNAPPKRFFVVSCGASRKLSFMDSRAVLTYKAI